MDVGEDAADEVETTGDEDVGRLLDGPDPGDQGRDAVEDVCLLKYREPVPKTSKFCREVSWLDVIPQ